MRWQTKVRPPNRDFYLDRCRGLERCLKRADIMPPMLIAANCWFVLKRALGSDWLVLRWMLLNIAHDRYEDYRQRLWFTWHYYVRLRTRDEIAELVDQQLEKMTGDDHREWPNVIIDEESTNEPARHQP